jgi:ribosome recycling factor
MSEFYNKAKEGMQKSLDSLKRDLGSISTGRATPSLLDTVKVDCYGSFMPLKQVANINVPDASTLSIQVWDKGMVSKVEKAIINSNLGFNPMVDGQLVRINIPKLSEERRKEFCKLVKKYGEDKKISVRNARREVIDGIKDAGLSEDEVKRAKDDVQKCTDEHIKKIDEMVKAKEDDIMKI